MGESGEAAAYLLKDEGARVTVLDSGDRSRLESKIAQLRSRQIASIVGMNAIGDRSRYDCGILSPGIDPSAPLVRAFVEKRIEMIGELELSYELCGCPVVAITGTNGKTTTTELVARMLNHAGVRTAACGNIGPAFAAKVPQSRELDIMTVEVSSFQLEAIRTFRPKIAVWLNLTPDHLDRYSNFEEYRSAKLRIFENQQADDFAIVNLRDELPEIRAKKISFSAYVSGGDFDLRGGTICYRGKPVLNMGYTQLRGLHNAENLMAAMAVGVAYGLSFEQMTPALSSYRALPHRCELIRLVGGVEYVNDSKATNIDALEKALQSETRPVVLIAGGKDKGFEFESLTELVAQKTRAVVLIGEMAQRIESFWGARVACQKAASLQQAIELAQSLACAGDVVLFSPGTSSFDMFKNYADRGNQFRAIVNALQP